MKKVEGESLIMSITITWLFINTHTMMLNNKNALHQTLSKKRASYNKHTER